MSIKRVYDVNGLNPFNGFVPGTVNPGIQQQNRTIPADRNYQFFLFELINVLPSEIVLLRQNVNNSPVKTFFNGADLDLMNQNEGLPAANITGGNSILMISERRDRLFGGGLSYLTAPPKGSPYPVGFVTGTTKDLETNTSLNCGIKDENGFSLNTISFDVWIQVPANQATTPVINVNGYGYDPFPGGPGLMKFVDAKQFNAPMGIGTLDKGTAFTLGDGQRMNLDQILLMNPFQDALDLIQIYHNSQLHRNRNTNVNDYIHNVNALKATVAGIFTAFDSREMLYGDELLDISGLNSAIRLQLQFPVARSFTMYQISNGQLLPSAPGNVTASTIS